MKKLLSILLVICTLYLHIPVYAVSTGSVASTESISTEQPTDEIEITSIHGIDANQALLGMNKIVDNVRAAIVYETNSETLMYAWNPDAQMYPASLVKIMTVFLAIEHSNLTDLVTVSQSVLSSVPSDAVSAKLVPGEKLSVQDLLYCILLGSASDACVAIGEHIAGSESAFVDMMNQRAVELGCTGTYFINSHGLHDDDQYTTARDSARILSAALNNEVFAKIFAANDYLVEKTNLSDTRRISSGNYMKDTNSKLYYDSRVIGGRTGVTQDGRRCLATVSQRNGMQLVTIVMGAESVYQEDGYSAISIGGYRETTKLLDLCLDGYQTAQLLFENQALRQSPVNGGNCDLVMGPKLPFSTVLPANVTNDDLIYRYLDKQLTLPIEKGQHVSDLQIWNGTVCIAQAELYALNGVVKANDESFRDAEIDTDRTSWVVWIIAITIIVVGGLVLIRYSRKMKTSFSKKRRRHRRDDRRRYR